MCKRDVNGAFKLIPISIRGLAHMGLQFSEYMILYLSLYFGWKPSPASCGVISTLLLQFVASFTPSRPRDMGPEEFVAYEYVGDGAFAEPWRDIRPWTPVGIWAYGLQSCLGYKSLRDARRKVEGGCSTAIVLWGLHICTENRRARMAARNFSPINSVVAGVEMLYGSPLVRGVTPTPRA